MEAGRNPSGWRELERYLHNAEQSGRPPSPVIEADVRGRHAQARGEGLARAEAQARADARTRERSIVAQPASSEPRVGGATPAVQAGRTFPTAAGGQPWTSTPANVTAVVEGGDPQEVETARPGAAARARATRSGGSQASRNPALFSPRKPSPAGTSVA